MVDERIQVKGGQGRCPFCHDEVRREERVACVGCLAAHHAGCWDEHGRCSSCGEGEALRRTGEAPAPTPQVEVTPRAQTRHPWQVEEPEPSGYLDGLRVQNPNLAPSDSANANGVVLIMMMFGVVALVAMLLGLLAQAF